MPFKKGQSGNPTGPKPGTFSLVAILKRKLQETQRGQDEDEANLIINQYIKLLKSGKPELLKDVLDRIDGKPKQGVELTGEDGDAIDVNHTIRFIRSNANP